MTTNDVSEMHNGHLRRLDEDLRAKKEPWEVYLILLGCAVWLAIIALFSLRHSPGLFSDAASSVSGAPN